MPRNSSGTYSLPVASYVAGTTILSADMNSNLSDIGTALTQSLATTGVSSMTGPIKLAAGSAAAPSLTLASDTTTGFYNSAAGTWVYVTGSTAIATFAPTGVTIGTLTVTNLTVTGSFSVAANRIVGEMIDYGGTAAPALWLLCYGQAINRTTYASLFGAIGTAFGAGDGSTTFNVPDLRGRVTAGKDDMGGVAANRITNAASGVTGTTLGATGGAQSITLVTANMPSHAHTQQGTFASGAPSSTAHTHDFSGTTVANTFNAGGGGTSVVQQLGNATVTTANPNAGDLSGHIHNVTISGSTATAGSGTAYGNLPPVCIVNKIIYAAV